MKKLLIRTFFSLIAIMITDLSQASDLDTLKSRLAYTASYRKGIKSDNGYELGIERYCFESDKFNVLQNASILIQQRSDVYTGIALTIGSTLRRTYKWGIYFDHSIKAGYAGHYYHFDIYETNEHDEIMNVGHKWKSSMIIGYSFALGYDFSKITKMNVQVFAKPNVFLKFPNNDNLFLLNNFSLELGIAFRSQTKK
jgi:hypothetical protein